MSINILSNSQKYAYNLKSIVKNYLNKYEKHDQVRVFQRNFYQGPKVNNFELYFIDLDNQDCWESGIDLAKKIRETDFLGLITVFSQDINYSLILQKKNICVFDFVTIEHEYNDFLEEIHRSLDEYFFRKHSIISYDGPYYSITQKKNLYRFPHREIYYFSTEFNHKINLVTKNKKFQFVGTLDEIESKGDNFLRIHRSYVVNLAAVTGIDTQEKVVIITNTEKLPISRKYYKTVKSVFMDQQSCSI